MSEETPICDKHYKPMLSEGPVTIVTKVSATHYKIPHNDTVKCPSPPCGRCYSKSLGYFTTNANGMVIDQLKKPCPTLCNGSFFMTMVDDGKGQRTWHCFVCGHSVPS